MGDSNAGSSSTYHPHKKYHWTTNLDITVTIQYREPKASNYFSKFNKQSIAVLRNDLLALKIPHPKAENIGLASHGVVEFSWSNVEPYKVLHHNLILKLRPHDPDYKEILKHTLEERQMIKAAFWESPTGQGTTAKKRRYQSSAGDSDCLPPSKKFAPDPTPREREGVTAEQFLSDTLKTLAVKPEPIDVPLPPAPPSGSFPTLSSRVSIPGQAPGSSSGGASSGWDKSQAPTASATSEPLLKDLMHDLWEVRKSISYAREKEESLVAKIQNLFPQVKIPPMNAEQKELTELRLQLEEARNDAVAQRKQKDDLQRSLDAIRRESKEPFIVPGLIDAFISISNLAGKIV